MHVHHGTREAPGRLVVLEGDLHQLRLERPLLAADGDRVVVRRSSPPATLGGGVVLDAGARRHGRRPDVLAALARRRDGVAEPAPAAPPALAPPPRPRDPARVAAEQALEARLLDAGHAMLSEGDADPRALRALRADGRAVRVAGRSYAHALVVQAVRETALRLIDAEGAVTLARLRDALGASRRVAQAFLEHLDEERVTRRLPDDRRVRREEAAA